MDWRALGTSFFLIFLAELVDKTAYTVLLLSTRSGPLPVLLGAWAAFLAQGLVALALGSLAVRLPQQVLRWGAAGILLFFGLLLFFREEHPEELRPIEGKGAVAAAFALVFVAEIGDATQLGTVALMARFGSPWSVFIGATLALWSVAVIAVALGNALGTRLPRRVLRKAAGALFCVFALVSALY
ncbi:MAG: TMEM165/GDT1 family protein [Deltaproteobacteria bacterium]|nr:MAG: TMEM165/GDT1 family protein [Deltaproteobacteria bacterium]